VGGGYFDGPVLEAFTGWAALGYDHGYDGEVFYLGLAFDPRHVEGLSLRAPLSQIRPRYSR
jgi:hypothetical protein